MRVYWWYKGSPHSHLKGRFRMKKTIKDGSRYFRQKDILRPIGAVLLPVGLLVLYFGWSYFSYIFGAIAAPAGLVLFIIGGAKHISDSDMAEQVEHALLDYDRSVTDMAGYERVVLKQPAPVELSAYSFGDEAKYFKRGKSGTPLSDRYTRTHIFYTKAAILVVGRTLSLTELGETDGAGVTDFSEQIALAEISSAALEQHETTVTLTNTGKPATVRWCELVLMGDGGELLRVPAANDMDASNLCEDLNRRAGR